MRGNMSQSDQQFSAWLLAQSSLKYFMVKFLRDPKSGEPLKWFPHYDDWYDIVLNEKRSDAQCPRGHGKSIFWSYAVPLWDVIRGKASVLIVSYSEDQVRDLIRIIKNEVETNPLLTAIRPSTREIWGSDILGFADGGIVQGLGFGTSSRGKHPKRIVGDDVLKDLGSMSPEDQERAWFGIITGMAMADTQMHVIGTPVDFDDLLQKLENNPVYRHWKKPAIKPDGSPLCPQLFTLDDLDFRRKEMGSLNFAREFLLERIDPTTQPFKRDYETLYEAPPPRERMMCVATVCDPAYTEGDGDATAITTVGLTHGNHGYVLSAKEIRREDPGAIVEELFKDIRAWQPDNVGIKRRKGDAISFTFNEKRVRENLWDFRYVEIKDTKSKADKSRIGGLVPRWEARSIHLHKNMTNFLRQIYEFRLDDSHAHDDLLDALADCFSPEMSQPNAGRRSVRDTSYRDSRPLFKVGGNTAEPQTKSGLKDLWSKLDRRVSDKAAA
jgi:hypothetical protein